MVLFTPSVRSDFQSSQECIQTVRNGLVAVAYHADKLSMTGGAIYTGRQDYPVLPTMGLYWTPSPLWKLDIQFPSPRMSRRLLKDGDRSETWAYLSGVFGGNTWAVKRAVGQDDQLTLRDLRLVLGIEYLLRENRGVFRGDRLGLQSLAGILRTRRARSTSVTQFCCGPASSSKSQPHGWGPESRTSLPKWQGVAFRATEKCHPNCLAEHWNIAFFLF